MRFEGLDLNLLVALDALITERNVSVAADRVHLSQSAMSGALSRLREFFEDDLLVSVGRRMVLTPRAEGLAEPVRNALQHIKSSITSGQEFDPAKSTRRFSILASDYPVAVMIAETVRRAAEIAPNIQFELSNPYEQPSERLERAEVDMLIMPDHYTSKSHPSEKLFDDTYVVVAWTENRLIKGKLDLEQFSKLGQVVPRLGKPPLPSYEERTAQTARRVEVVTPSFGSVPSFIVGTNRIGAMHKRLAERYAKVMPLKLYPHPVAIPPLTHVAQWNKFNNNDGGIRWLVDLLKQCVN